MKKTVITGIMALALALPPVQALAQEQGPAGRGPGKFGPGPDEAAVKAIRESRQEFRTETLELRRGIRLKRAELRVLLLKPQTTEEELLGKNKELQELANLQSDKRLVWRFQLMHKYPELEKFRGFKEGLRGEKPGRKGFERRDGRFGRPGRGLERPGPAQDRPGPDSEMMAELREAGRKFMEETADLRRRMRLKRAELKVLMLTPETTADDLLAKNREIRALADQLGQKRLLQRFEMNKKYPELALAPGPRPGSGPGMGMRPERRF